MKEMRGAILFEALESYCESQRCSTYPTASCLPCPVYSAEAETHDTRERNPDIPQTSMDTALEGRTKAYGSQDSVVGGSDERAVQSLYNNVQRKLF